MENSTIISEIAEIRNNYFINVAANIGNDHTISDLQNHTSILEIKIHNQQITYDFSYDVPKIFINTKYKKATGPDVTSPIFLKHAGSEIVLIISRPINKSIELAF